MPLGIVIVLILSILISLGYADEFCRIFKINRKLSVVFLIAIVFSYTLYPIKINGITAYWQPFMLILVFSLYAVIKTKTFIILLSSVISSAILWGISLKIPPQPIGLIYEPFLIYALVLFLINLIFIRKKLLVLNTTLSICFFGLLMVLTRTHNSLFCPDAFSAICVSSVLSFLLKGCVKNAPDYCR